jgi:hypothetical protein
VRRAANLYVTPDRAAVVLVGDAEAVREQAAPYADRVEEFGGPQGGEAAG